MALYRQCCKVCYLIRQGNLSLLHCGKIAGSDWAQDETSALGRVWVVEEMCTVTQRHCAVGWMFTLLEALRPGASWEGSSTSSQLTLLWEQVRKGCCRALFHVGWDLHLGGTYKIRLFVLPSELNLLSLCIVCLKNMWKNEDKWKKRVRKQNESRGRQWALVNTFWLKGCYVRDRATPVFFCLEFIWDIFFPSFYFQTFCIFILRFVSCKLHVIGFYFYILTICVF